jgi:hypothetical protein
LKITEGEVIRNYERDLIPDPTRYYVKDDPVYTTAYYPELTLIPSRYTRPNRFLKIKGYLSQESFE